MSTEESKAGSEEMRTLGSQPGTAGRGPDSEVDETRRALIHAAWVIPAVIALKVPSNAFAGYSGGGGDDGGGDDDGGSFLPSIPKLGIDG